MRLRVVLAMSLAALVLTAPAAADWALDGAAGAHSRAGALAAGNAPAASASGRNVEVSWSASGGAVPIEGYLVRRYDAEGQAQAVAASCAGVLSGLGCAEQDVPPGEWTYSVTPAKGNWRGLESPPGSPVTVAAPSLLLEPETVHELPAQLAGGIGAFLSEQTVVFRLDDPESGTLLSGAVVPTPTPQSGSASVEVTLPAGTQDGIHTVYGIGSRGDIAGATVNIEAGCSEPGNQIVAPSRDSYVDSLLAGLNFGSSGTLQVGPAYLLILAQQRALIGFELPARPERCTLVGATLRLYATSPGAGRTIEALRAAAPWSEVAVTWSNQPATAGVAATSASLGSSGWQEWGVLDQAEAMYTGANHGFLVKDSAASGVLPPRQGYQSREGAPADRRPQLVLEFG